ncbi:MAG: AAA family ATPase [Dehalococcoidales bacterium]
MKVVSIVGMAGSGKSVVAAVFESKGFTRIRFGDITDREVIKRGLELNEYNERMVREALRREHGMEIYARFNLERIDAAREHSDVVVDGLYSWEEYILLKEYYGDAFRLVAVFSSPETRYRRLSGREERPLARYEASGRDRSEIEKVNKGGPIAMADFTLINESSLEEVKKATESIIHMMRQTDYGKTV